MTEVHDCFSITELITMEDLGLSQEGEAVKDVLDGVFDADGDVPCQIDGGLKCFGHPIGASGLRMLYEMYTQLLGRADERQLADPKIGLTHNLGGFPHMNVQQRLNRGPVRRGLTDGGKASLPPSDRRRRPEILRTDFSGTGRRVRVVRLARGHVQR